MMHDVHECIYAYLPSKCIKGEIYHISMYLGTLEYKVFDVTVQLWLLAGNVPAIKQ